jgi:hypothetical protein
MRTFVLAEGGFGPPLSLFTRKLTIDARTARRARGERRDTPRVELLDQLVKAGIRSKSQFRPARHRPLSAFGLSVSGNRELWALWGDKRPP